MSLIYQSSASTLLSVMIKDNSGDQILCPEKNGTTRDAVSQMMKQTPPNAPKPCKLPSATNIEGSSSPQTTRPIIYNQTPPLFDHIRRQPLHRRLLWHLSAPVSSSLSSASLLLLLTIMTGIQDATTFPDYHCFASNQTGNTIFLTLAVILPSLNGDMFVTSNIGIALALFLAGGWLTGQLGHMIAEHGRKRWWLILCNLLQTVLVFIAAGIQFRYGVELSGASALCTIGLLAFASGSQVVQSRSLSMTEISTAMATAAWVDLMIDPHLFSGFKGNRGRNRRVAFLVALVVGGFLGAAIYRYAGSATAILVSAVGKAVVTVGWMVVPGETAAKSEEKRSRASSSGTTAV